MKKNYIEMCEVKLAPGVPGKIIRVLYIRNGREKQSRKTLAFTVQTRKDSSLKTIFKNSMRKSEVWISAGIIEISNN